MDTNGVSPLLIFIFVTLLVVITIDLLTLAAMRAGFFRLSAAMATILMLGLVLAGAVTLYQLFVGGELDTITRLSTVCLYLALATVYVEARSLLSRGYSLRILADLSKAGGQASLEQLKNSYGAGKGMSGMIEKRLETMRGLGLLQISENKVGPLSVMGKAFAVLGLAWRKMLCLEHVG